MTRRHRTVTDLGLVFVPQTKPEFAQGAKNEIQMLMK